MAEEAHKEPSMEEILASIRKIISEDDTQAPAPAANILRPEEISTGNDAGEDEELSLDDLAAKPARDEDMFEEFDLSDLEEADETVEDVEDVVVEAVEDSFEDTFEDDDLQGSEDDFDSFTRPEETVEEALTEAEEPVEDTPVFAPAASVAPSPKPSQSAHAETAMLALTEETTDHAAAGALARLVSRMDMGSENTLEGLVKELLRPMIKEWLDANLPSIVEDKVEAEVQRIARLAR